MVTLTKEDFIAKRKHCFLLLVTPYFDIMCTCVTSNLWNVTFSVRISLSHLLSFDFVLNKYLSRQINLPLHSFALLYSVELSARGRVFLAVVMLQTLPDHHSHHYNVKTDITHALHLGCRIYMCSGIAQWLERRTHDWKVQERQENFLLQGQLSVLTLISVSVPPPCYRSST